LSGFETNDLEGLALVETVLRDNEDGIFRMMDILKSRRQEIDTGVWAK
jgi:hypothetical protein